MASRGPGRPPKRDERYAANGMLIPPLTADTFQIYSFAPPTIQDFPEITADRRAEKVRLDKQDADAYIDDGADDWDDFSVTLAYDADHSEGTMARAIASVFMNRAKVAYRSRKSWAKFEDEELAVKTQAAARAGPDLAKRQILLDECLCERSRLQVFDRIKVRLCTEIFLEHYNERRLAARRDSLMTAKEEYPDAEKLLLGWDRFHAKWKGSQSIKPWPKDICSNCGTARPNYLEDPECPQCKTIEEAVWSERPESSGNRIGKKG